MEVILKDGADVYLGYADLQVVEFLVDEEQGRLLFEGREPLMHINDFTHGEIIHISNRLSNGFNQGHLTVLSRRVVGERHRRSRVH